MHHEKKIKYFMQGYFMKVNKRFVHWFISFRNKEIDKQINM